MTWKTALAAGLIGATALTGTALASPARATGPQLPQLVASVCDMTTYTEGKGPGPDPLPQSVWEGDCLARTNGDPLFIGRYTSESAVQHDLTHFPDFIQKMGGSPKAVEAAKRGGGTYVLVPMPNGTAVLFEDANSNYSTVGLSPLQSFGFAIYVNPPQV